MKASFYLTLLAILLIACNEPTNETQSIEMPEQEILYIGTFSQRGSQGVYSYTFDRQNHSFAPFQTTSTPESPSFLALTPDQHYLYTVNREGIEADSPLGSVSAFAIEPQTGKLDSINQVSSMGTAPCHIVMDDAAQWIFVSHYGNAVLSIFPINEDGSIGSVADTVQLKGSSVNADRQQAAHAHAIQLIPGTPYFAAADLGSDKIWFYEWSDGEIKAAPLAFIPTPPGSGPRHFRFRGNLLYVAEELTSTVSVCKLDIAGGTFEDLQHLSTLPEDFEGTSYVADIHFSPDGRFAYISNRGHNSLAIFSVDATTGKLSIAGFESTRGDHPRNFMIDPQGDFVLVANMNTDDIWYFERNQETGLLSPTETKIEVPAPVCLEMIKL